MQYRYKGKLDRYNEVLDRYNGVQDRYNRIVDCYSGLVNGYNGSQMHLRIIHMLQVMSGCFLQPSP